MEEPCVIGRNTDRRYNEERTRKAEGVRAGLQKSGSSRLVGTAVVRHLPRRPPLPSRPPARLSPTPLPLRARSATEIVDAAFQLYRRDPVTYLFIAALCYAPILVLQLLILGPAAELEEQMAALTAGYSIAILFGYWISVSLMSAVIIRLASEDYLGRKLEPAVAVRDAVVKLPTVMFAYLLKYILLMIGLFLFLIGLLYMLARYFAVTTAIVIEDRGVFTAFGRSAVLSRGRKLHILGTLLLAFLIFMIVYFAALFLASIGGSMVIITVLSTAASIVIYPMFAITEMLLYYDARVRSEGYDIEMMAEGL